MTASGRPCSTLHEPGKARANDLWSRALRWAAQTRRPKEVNERGTHEAVKDVTLQEATESTRTERSSQEQRDREVFDQEECMKRTENCTTRTRPERDARKAEKEAVTNVAERNHETPSRSVCSLTHSGQ